MFVCDDVVDRRDGPSGDAAVVFYRQSLQWPNVNTIAPLLVVMAQILLLRYSIDEELTGVVSAVQWPTVNSGGNKRPQPTERW